MLEIVLVVLEVLRDTLDFCFDLDFDPLGAIGIP